MKISYGSSVAFSDRFKGNDGLLTEFLYVVFWAVFQKEAQI